MAQELSTTLDLSVVNEHLQFGGQLQALGSAYMCVRHRRVAILSTSASQIWHSLKRHSLPSASNLSLQNDSIECPMD